MHLVLELLAFTVGFNLYRLGRTPSLMTSRQAAVVLAGALLGGLLGAHALVWGSKTVVGGLLGGTLGVELAKRLVGVSTRTGDDVVFPLAVGMVIGRLGCFLSGLDDHTHGTVTTLPWGVDFGDGLARHPAQIYEALFIAGLGLLLWRRKKARPYLQGDLFRGYMVGYLGYRFVADLWKPYPEATVGPFTTIQIAALLGALCYAPAARRLVGTR